MEDKSDKYVLLEGIAVCKKKENVYHCRYWILCNAMLGGSGQ